jgi:uroporphyrinogen decarboxylase
MNKIERVRGVLAGTKPDRPPVSFWYHFSSNQTAGQPAIDAHTQHAAKYDLDFIKVMNDNDYPRGVDVIESLDQLKKLEVLDGISDGFAAQLDLLQRLKEAVGKQLLTTTTIFAPWSTLRNLMRSPNREHGPPRMDEQADCDKKLTEFLKADRAAVKAAVAKLGQTLANFARACIEAGADGIFLSVRDDWVDTPANGDGTYDEIVKPADLAVCEAAEAGTFNMLHVCGKALDFERFAGYPVHVLNWADRAAGPSIAYARDRVKPALSGGVDNLKELPDGTPEQVAEQVRDAVHQAKDRPILITPGCTYDPGKVPDANLFAMVETAEALTY